MGRLTEYIVIRRGEVLASSLMLTHYTPERGCKRAPNPAPSPLPLFLESKQAEPAQPQPDTQETPRD